MCATHVIHLTGAALADNTGDIIPGGGWPPSGSSYMHVRVGQGLLIYSNITRCTVAHGANQRRRQARGLRGVERQHVHNAAREGLSDQPLIAAAPLSYMTADASSGATATPARAGRPTTFIMTSRSQCYVPSSMRRNKANTAEERSTANVRHATIQNEGPTKGNTSEKRPSANVREVRPVHGKRMPPHISQLPLS